MTRGWLAAIAPKSLWFAYVDIALVRPNQFFSEFIVLTLVLAIGSCIEAQPLSIYFHDHNLNLQ